MAKVDVVVPCYNYGRFLRTCVLSILHQSVKDVRVLIIDDASSDETPSVARTLAEFDKRVVTVTHSANWGHLKTYNQGIEWATADYFLLLSADDMLLPGALQRAVDIMDANADVVLTHGEVLFWVDDQPLPEVEQERNVQWRRQDLIEEMCAYGGNLVRTPTAIVRTTTQKAVGGYRPALPHSGDMEMWMRLAARGSIARIDALQAIYRKHQANMSDGYYDRVLADLQQREQAFASLFNELSGIIPNADTLRTQAIRTLAEKAYWSGMVQLSRGRFKIGAALLRYSFDLEPALRYVPPFRAGRSIVGEAARHLFGRCKRALFSVLEANGSARPGRKHGGSTHRGDAAFGAASKRSSSGNA